MRDPASIVLIESDWNLKLEMLMNAIYVQASINRIRLEFKVKAKLTWTTRSAAVLIESDWNLKELHGWSTGFRNGINRIRLEFKGRM